MPVLKAPPTRRCINYKKIEAPVFNKMESKLCEEMGLTISDLHKIAIKRLWNARQNKYELELV